MWKSMESDLGIDSEATISTPICDFWHSLIWNTKYKKWKLLSHSFDYYFTLFLHCPEFKCFLGGKHKNSEEKIFFSKSGIFDSWRACLFCAIEFSIFWKRSLAIEMMLYKIILNLDFVFPKNGCVICLINIQITF